MRTSFSPITLLNVHPVHFSVGLLEIDPWNRLTAFQASKHPFITGHTPRIPVSISDRAVISNQLDCLDFKDAIIFWKPPWDPCITRRKHLMVQKSRISQSSGKSNEGYLMKEPTPVRPGNQTVIRCVCCHIPW